MLDGDLFIQDTQNVTLFLPNLPPAGTFLQRITETLRIQDNEDLTSLGDQFDLLEEVGVNVVLRGNGLTEIAADAFPSLRQIADAPKAGPGLSITNGDDLLQRVSGFNALEQINANMLISTSPSITTIDGFTSLTAINGTRPPPRECCVPRASRRGSDSLALDAHCSIISGSVVGSNTNGDLIFRGLERLSDFSGLSNLEVVSGEIRFTEMCTNSSVPNICNTPGALAAGFASLRFAGECSFAEADVRLEAAQTPTLVAACQVKDPGF